MAVRAPESDGWTTETVKGESGSTKTRDKKSRVTSMDCGGKKGKHAERRGGSPDVCHALRRNSVGTTVFTGPYEKGKHCPQRKGIAFYIL